MGKKKNMPRKKKPAAGAAPAPRPAFTPAPPLPHVVDIEYATVEIRSNTGKLSVEAYCVGDPQPWLIELRVQDAAGLLLKLASKGAAALSAGSPTFPLNVDPATHALSPTQ